MRAYIEREINEMTDWAGYGSGRVSGMLSLAMIFDLIPHKDLKELQVVHMEKLKSFHAKFPEVSQKKTPRPKGRGGVSGVKNF